RRRLYRGRTAARRVRPALGVGRRRDRDGDRGTPGDGVGARRAVAADAGTGARDLVMARRREWTRESLAEGVRTGDKRALARAISLVENGDSLAYELIRDLYPQTGHTYAIGITGPPGVGKSSLISGLVRHVRERGPSVGVISVDPSSPFSHGALLGDRIRLS